MNSTEHRFCCCFSAPTVSCMLQGTAPPSQRQGGRLSRTTPLADRGGPILGPGTRTYLSTRQRRSIRTEYNIARLVSWHGLILFGGVHVCLTHASCCAVVCLARPVLIVFGATAGCRCPGEARQGRDRFPQKARHIGRRWQRDPVPDAQGWEPRRGTECLSRCRGQEQKKGRQQRRYHSSSRRRAWG